MVYPALDSKVRNVTLAYSVEHEDEEHLFEQLFQLLSRALGEPEGREQLATVRLLACKVRTPGQGMPWGRAATLLTTRSPAWVLGGPSRLAHALGTYGSQTQPHGCERRAPLVLPAVPHASGGRLRGLVARRAILLAPVRAGRLSRCP